MARLEWGPDFQLEQGELRLVTVGEITRAMHFPEASSLYVHYALYLPPGKDILRTWTLMGTK